MKKLLLTIFSFLSILTIAFSQTNPMVAITAPTKYSIIYSNQKYLLSANASDADGIEKVEFYAGSKLLGTDTEAPYTTEISIANLPLPTWNWADWAITVKAYDKTGAMSSVTTPSNVWISIRPTFDAGIRSAGFDGRGSEERVIKHWITLNKNGFLQNITSATIGFKYDDQPEQFIDWKGNVYDPNFSAKIYLPEIKNTNGEHKITYRIVSRNGQESDEIAANDSYSFSFQSKIVNKAMPIVSLVTPVASLYVTSSIFSNQTYTFSAKASDPDGTVKKVDFYMDDVLIGSDDTAPYEISKSDLQVGSHVVVAKATDDLEGVGSSLTAKFIVKPSLDVAVSNIMQPLTSNALSYIAPVVTIKNTGSEVINSVKIQYSVDGGSPVILNWFGTVAAGATANVTLEKFRNENGAHSFLVTVSDPNGKADGDYTNNIMTRIFTSNITNALPTASVGVPSYRSIIYEGTNFTFTGKATDRDGWITKVEFYLNEKLIGTDTEAPYELTRNDMAIGTHAVTVKSYDDRNGVTTSNPTTLIVLPALNIGFARVASPSSSASTTNITPTVTVKNLGNITVTSATFTYSLDGGEAKTFNWTGSLIAGGSTNIVLPAFRNENGAHNLVFTLSNPNGGVDGDISNNTIKLDYVSTVNNAAPTARVSSPSFRSTVFEGAEFTFTAVAADRDGWITKVEFYLAGNLIGTDTEAPFEIKRNDMPVGTHAVTIKAYDDRGAVMLSNATTLVVSPALNVAVISIMQPALTATTSNISPVITLKNLGNAPVTTAEISYSVDGGEAKTINWTGTIAIAASANITLPAYRNENGSHSFAVTVSKPNDGTDGDNANNSMTRAYTSAIINAAPTARVMTPSYRSTIKSTDAFTLTAIAADRDGWITKVEFYLGTSMVGTDTEAPYALTLNSWPVGTHAVTVKAYDDRNGVTTSLATTLIVTQAVSGLAVNVDNTAKIMDNSNNKMAAQTETNAKEAVESEEILEERNSETQLNNNVKTSNSLQIMTNPTIDFAKLNVNIAERGDYVLTISDISGRVLQSKKVALQAGANNVETDVTKFTEGMYIITINNNKILMSKKLLISK